MHPRIMSDVKLRPHPQRILIPRRLLSQVRLMRVDRGFTNWVPSSCTQTLGLPAMIDLFLEYFQETGNTLDAFPLYVIFNLHAPAVADAPESPAPSISGTDLPSSTQLVGSLMDATLGTYIYGPPELERERANVNRSWFSVATDDQPIAEYFTMEEASDGTYRSPDGWPCENYLQGVKAKRLLLGWGVR
jgi:hypothetical protein